MKIIDTQTNQIIGSHIKWANTFFTRLRGLMFVKELMKGYGILLYPCNSIHMFFMNFPLDVLFLDAQMRVVKQINSIRPGQLSPLVKNARYALEMRAGEIAQYGDLSNHTLRIEE